MPSSPSTTPENAYVALLHGPDQPGLVARVASWIYERRGNILHADQHRDRENNIFFQRIEWMPASAAVPADPHSPALSAADAENFQAFAHSLGMHARIASTAHRTRVALFVSKYDHCFHDVLLRWRAGEFNCDIALIISNHTDLAPAAASYGIPFHHLPVNAAQKSAAENAQLDLLRRERIELAVLARYMQVLSPDFLAAFARPVINIHHSFLPAFAGGRPYHQAHARGVKLIGATAHYATPVLDDGPIIQQDVARVTHRHDVDDLVRLGRDLEKLVLARALRSHLEHRVLAYANKTVVFD